MVPPDTPTRTTRLQAARYTARDWADLEHERLWPRVWQIACTEDCVPEPGDQDPDMVTPRSHLRDGALNRSIGGRCYIDHAVVRPEAHLRRPYAIAEEFCPSDRNRSRPDA